MEYKNLIHNILMAVIAIIGILFIMPYMSSCMRRQEYRTCISSPWVTDKAACEKILNYVP